MKTRAFSKLPAILALLYFFVSPSLQVSSDNGTLASQNGAPIANQRNSATCGNNRGPILLEDQLLVERLAIQNRERTPERTVHARGTVAKGYFELTSPIPELTYADVFNGEVGKKTPVAVRFSTVIHSKGSPEFLRDPRGFAVKFYTAEGNWDLVGNNFPVFFIRDGIQFPEMVRSLKPDPLTGIAAWWRTLDFFSHVPESVHMFTFLLDDMGIPAGYQFMNGSGVHTFVFVNASSHPTFVRFTWKSVQGVQSLTDEEASVKDFNFATFSLYKDIEDKKFPQWELYIQTLPVDVNVSSLSFDPLDTTKEWPTYGPETIVQKKIGVLTLDTNIKDHFLENELITLSPSRLVPGIQASNERMLQARLFAYPDAQRYRVGINSDLIPINKPISGYSRPYTEGRMNTLDPEEEEVNYFPSKLSKKKEATLPANPIQTVEGAPLVKLREYFPVDKDDFIQARKRIETFDPERYERFVFRVAATLTSEGVTPELQLKWLRIWENTSSALAQDISSLISPSTSSPTSSPTLPPTLSPTPVPTASPTPTPSSAPSDHARTIININFGGLLPSRNKTPSPTEKQKRESNEAYLNNSYSATESHKSELSEDLNEKFYHFKKTFSVTSPLK